MYIDVQIRQHNKTSEELCGDTVGWHREGNDTVLVLSDGLGSGVKANILSTMTQRIVLRMFKEHLPIEEIAETLAATLPVDRVRHMAYSTFTLVRVAEDGATDIVEYDNPPTYIFRSSIMEHPERVTRTTGKLTFTQIHHKLNEGDTLVVVSDGVIHAGLADDSVPWTWDTVGEKIQRSLQQGAEAEEIADTLEEAVMAQYQKKPNDDVSVAVLKCRNLRELVLAAGPPSHPDDDHDMAEKFRALPGKKVICGGTLAKIMSRELRLSLSANIDINELDSKVPPLMKMDGVDLVMEGVITLMHAIDELDTVKLRKQRMEVHNVSFLYRAKKPGFGPYGIGPRTPIIADEEEETPAQLLARELRLADKVTILLGRAVNEAHVAKDLPVHLGLKTHLVQHLAEKLRSRGKIVDVIMY